VKAPIRVGIGVVAALGLLGTGAWLRRDAPASARPPQAVVAGAPTAAAQGSAPFGEAQPALADAARNAAALDEFDLESELHATVRAQLARLVEVIDLILSTPCVDGSPRVKLSEVHGPVRPQRPWLPYRFDDPELQ
jgi:hypothetical protein